MLFIVGTRSYNLKNGQTGKFLCPKCSEQAALDYSLYKRYAHLTLIPLFPVDKEIYASCSSCSEIIEFSELPEDAKPKIEAIKMSTSSKAPFWMYSGTAILVGLAIFGAYSFLNAGDNSKKYLKNPKPGDVINLKLSNGYYSTIRIDGVTKDSVSGTLNDYDAYLPYETDNIDKPENYTDSKIKYSKWDLARLYDNGEINSIKRN